MPKTVDDYPRIAIRDYAIPQNVDAIVVDGIEFKLHRKQMRKRGERLYWLCDGCARRVTALYLRSGLYRCRVCHRLVYRVQLESKRQRERRHSARRDAFREAILMQVRQLLDLLDTSRR